MFRKSNRSTLWSIVAILGLLAASQSAVADQSSGASTVAPSRAIIAPSGPGGTEDKGSCNSNRGCKKLEKACLKIGGHEFKKTKPDGSEGVCTEKSSSQQTARTGSPTLAAVPQQLEDATCIGKKLCKALQEECGGGSFVWINKPNHATCKN